MENVINTIQNVAVDNRRQLWEKVLGDYNDAVYKIYSSHSSDEQKLHSLSDVYVNCKPDSSWEELVCCLYKEGEVAATQTARAFLPPKGRQLVTTACLIQCHAVHEPTLLRQLHAHCVVHLYDNVLFVFANKLVSLCRLVNPKTALSMWIRRFSCKNYYMIV